MRPLLILLALAAATFAAPLSGNKITADGTYTVTTIPGSVYSFAVAGDFGSGSLAINWNDGTTSTAYANSPATDAETWTFTAASKTLELVLSDSTDPDLTITIAEAGPSLASQLNASSRINISGTNLAGTGWNGNGVADGIFLGDLQNLGFARPDGGAMGSIYGWYNHDADGGEFLFESTHRIALAQGENGAIQIGLTRAVDNKSFIYAQARWTPTVGSPLSESMPLFFNAGTYGVSAAATSHVGIQGRATASGDNEMIFFAGSTFPDGPRTDGTMPEIAAVTVDGFRDPAGNSPPFSSLTDGATITITCSTTKGHQNHFVTLAGNRTLAFSGLTAGMRGTIIVSQDGTGNRTLTLPDAAATQSGFALSTGGYDVDLVSWIYNGTDIYFTIEKDFILPVDDDAGAFLAAASISETSTEGIAANNLVKQLKSDGVWEDVVEAWPMIGGSSTAHKEGLKQDYDATFGAGVTHDSNGITGNATSTGWMNTGINVSGLGLRDDIGIYGYNREQTTTAGGRIFGTVNTNARFYVTEASGILYGSGPCSGDINTCSATQSPDDRGHYWFGRTSSTSATIRFNSTSQTVTNAANTAPTDTIYFLAMNSASVATNPTNANFAFCAVTNGLTADQYADLRAAVDAFQTALGRSN